MAGHAQSLCLTKVIRKLVAVVLSNYMKLNEEQQSITTFSNAKSIQNFVYMENSSKQLKLQKLHK